jgi:hypothetical protein
MRSVRLRFPFRRRGAGKILENLVTESIRQCVLLSGRRGDEKEEGALLGKYSYEDPFGRERGRVEGARVCFRILCLGHARGL